MADAGTAAAGGDGDQPFMVSSLPLVFCDGRPVALENMPDRSLVKFVRFMLKCALGVEESRLRTVRRPSWWPRTVPYFNLKTSREVEKGHAERLRELVRCCYRGADCTYLIRFCADLERHCVAGRMAFKNNFDGSSSLIELATNRLVVTCRNENLEYDRSSQGPLSPRRHLLPRQLSRSVSQAMVQPPPDDIFLCDTCSAEFSSIEAVQAHERQCGAPPSEEGAASDGESSTSEPELQCASQTRFLSYVGLAPAEGSGRERYSSPSKRGGGAAAVARLRRGPGLLVRYPSIDISSVLGRRLGAGPPPPDEQPPEHERYCEEGERKRPARQPAFPVSWRPPRRARRIVYGWSHLYCFTAGQRAERRRVIRTGLTEQARRLVQTVLPCSVHLTRVTEDEIEEACRPKTPPPPPLQPAWKPPPSLQGSLWRPAQPPVRLVSWRTADSGGARSATSALTAAAAAAAAAGRGAASLRECRLGRPGVSAVGTRPGTAQKPMSPYSLPPGLSITPHVSAPRSQARPAAGVASQRPVWRPTLAGAGGAVIRSALARGQPPRPSAARGAPRGGGLKVMVTPGVPSRRPIGKEVRDNDTLLIDLCSSSDEEDDPPPAPPPPPLPPPRIKLEPTAAASTNGSGWQSKNAHSHWSRSCGGLANGVSSCASLHAGPDGGSSVRRSAAAGDFPAAPRVETRTATVTSADSDFGVTDAERPSTDGTRGTDLPACDDSSDRASGSAIPFSSIPRARKRAFLPSTDDGCSPDIHLLAASSLHRAASDPGCEGRVLESSSGAPRLWTIACRAA